MSQSNCSRQFIAVHDNGLDVEELATALADGMALSENLAVDSAKLADELKEIINTIQ